MSTPFVFVTTHRIKPGARDQFLALSAEYLTLVEQQEPRMLAHVAYESDDGDLVSIVQIHPDADSAEHHLQVVGPVLPSAAELVDNVAVEVYGEPGPLVRAAVEHNRAAGVAVRVTTQPLGGFART